MQGKTVSLSGVQAAIDTGTTLIGGPEADVQAIYANIPGSRRMTGVYAGYFEYPCSTDIAMDMTFGSFKVTIRSNDFNIGSYGDDASYCTGGVFVQGLAASSPVQWVVGDTMLKNVYSIYRMSELFAGCQLWENTSADVTVNLQLPLPSGSLIYLAREPFPRHPRPRPRRPLHRHRRLQGHRPGRSHRARRPLPTLPLRPRSAPPSLSSPRPAAST
jgi:hypothetical protein